LQNLNFGGLRSHSVREVIQPAKFLPKDLNLGASFACPFFENRSILIGS
jgi:hypothetical protein